jgi:hypothetical protein
VIFLEGISGGRRRLISRVVLLERCSSWRDLFQGVHLEELVVVLPLRVSVKGSTFD